MRLPAATLLFLGCITALVCISPAQALTPPSTQQWEAIRSAGQEGQVQQNLLRLSEFGQGGGVAESEYLSQIGRDFGLEVGIAGGGQASVSPTLDFDQNGVIDERDVLGLGYRESTRSPSMSLPYGTVADNNQPELLVVLIKFSDQEPTDMTNQGSDTDVNHNQSWADSSWFDLIAPGNLEDTSVAYYYKHASYGKLELAGTVFNNAAVCDADGWITSAYSREQIDGDGVGDTDTPFDAIIDALDQIDPYIDFSDYDSNNDGFMDGLVIIYAGPDDINTNMWHYWWHGTVSYFADGVRIYNGIWTGEEAYIQMWCHETGHQLGLPDLYDVGGADSGDEMPGIGYWGLMGGWTLGANGTGVIPAMPCAWSRLKLRWAEAVDVPTLATAESFTVNRATSVTPANTIFRLMRNGLLQKEYFLAEFRDADHFWDQNLPGSGGILIWHVDEDRTSRNNHDNAFNPQRVWLECAEGVGDPKLAGNPWVSGHNGDDGVDYFDDGTVPKARSNYSNAFTFVSIDPTSGNTGSSMTFEASNASASGLPGNAWDSPADGSTVSGMVTVNVASDATNRVEYYVNGCLKYVENAPAPYSGFSWDTTTAFDGTAVLKAMAVNTTGTDPVNTVYRTVTVDNGAGSGASLPWSDNFDAYTTDQNANLLANWNLHEDAMGLDLRIQDTPAAGSTGYSIAFAQASFPSAPSSPNTNDPNAGVYEGQDDEWLLTPRLQLSGLAALELNYKAAFKQAGWGQGILVAQITTDDGASWTDLESLTYSAIGSPFDAGNWSADTWAQRSVSLQPYGGNDAYIRLLFVGGVTANTAFGIDDFEVTGTEVTLTSVSPSRAVVGDTVTLSGSGFGTGQGSSEVRFNDGASGYIAQTTIGSWGDTEVTCAVPAGAVSGSPGGVWLYRAYAETSPQSLTVMLDPPDLDGLARR